MMSTKTSVRRWTDPAVARLAVVLVFAAASGCAQVATAPQQANRSYEQRISVETVGTGRDIILVPGLGASKEVMRPLAQRLSATHRVHLVQVAGFAGSPAPAGSDGAVLAPVAKALADYISVNDMKDPAVVGHSGGGAIGMMLALDHPRSISRLMVVDVLPFPAVLDGPADQSLPAVLARAVIARELALKQTADEFARTQRAAIGDAVVASADADRIHGWSVASERKVLAQAYYELATLDLRPRLSSMAMPLTVVFADQASHGAPPGWMRKRYTSQYESVPKVQFEEIKGARHFLLLDQPEAFYQVVERFANAKG